MGSLIPSKVVITAALTGSGPRKAITPRLPEQPDEIIADAASCASAGAAIVHIHARERDGSPSANPALFGKIIEGIRSYTELIVNASTGAGTPSRAEERTGILKAKPDIATLFLGTVVSYSSSGERALYPREVIEDHARTMADHGIVPECQMYNHAMFRELSHLRALHLIRSPLVINLVLGVPVVGGVGSDPHDLLTLSSYVPTEPRLVSVTAHDDTSLRLIALALALDLDIRVGLEDTPVPSKGQPHCSNAQLVERAARLVRSVGYEVATPEETREALALRHHTSSQPVTAS